MIENNIRGGIPSKTGDGYVKKDDDKKILFVDATNVFVWTTSESLLYVEKKIVEIVVLENIIKAPYDSSFGNFVKGDLKIPCYIEITNKIFPSCPEKISPQDFLVII